MEETVGGPVLYSRHLLTNCPALLFTLFSVFDNVMYSNRHLMPERGFGVRDCRGFEEVQRYLSQYLEGCVLCWSQVMAAS
jgi:hypothetical protein